MAPAKGTGFAYFPLIFASHFLYPYFVSRFFSITPCLVADKKNLVEQDDDTVNRNELN